MGEGWKGKSYTYFKKSNYLQIIQNSTIPKELTEKLLKESKLLNRETGYQVKS